MIKYVDLLYGKYLSNNGNPTIGGVQTYITDLCGIILELDAKPRIVQFAEEDFKHTLQNEIEVVGYHIESKREETRYQLLYDKAVQTRENKDVLTIFATDTLIPAKITGPCIAIQHGIFWDIPKDVKRTLIRQVVSKALASYKTVCRLERVDTVVCVDYNFQNWYRTQLQHITAKTLVIPNYTRIAPEYDKPENKLNIIFARRLFKYRGTRVFTEAIKRLLNETTNINVTIAGTGEDEQWMHEQLDSHDNVQFIFYESNESLETHKDKHIAVIPTVGSEGTSLSLLEAMSAQCACICTDVGGMTNIVIDGFNGLIVDAGNAEQLYRAMRILVDDAQLRKRIAKNGYETVKQGFSNEKWRTSWKKVLEEYLL